MYNAEPDKKNFAKAGDTGQKEAPWFLLVRPI